ncbi:transmembrane protein 88B, partial [Marmota marmota marmota]|uniref:transmembrane protein 88B n=1 Tax=Marmota marmota marmota TaxID=9994 RepID=UPI002092CFC8
MSDQERETEEDEGGGTLDTAPMLPQRPPDHHTSAPRSSGWSGLAIRGLKTLLLPGRALAVLLLHLLLPGTVFLLLLLPAAGIVYLGFLCHSRHYLAHSSSVHPNPHLAPPRRRPGHTLRLAPPSPLPLPPAPPHRLAPPLLTLRGVVRR